MGRDEDLALDIQQGKRDGLTLLVQRHHSPLLGFLYRMTGGDRALAEDLVQETFLRVLRSISQYQYPRPVKPWLYMIATNLARDHYKRAEMRHTQSMPDETVAMNGQQEWMPEEALIFDDETRRAVNALHNLPNHQREAVILRYYQELALAEIAEILDVPVGTVKSRISLGLGRLREMLLEQESE
ncbi:MAG: RNA polymerase sigma factor [Anaerolineae bacterium]|nr:RNA polymerase sigma factor [Anaerolineae bacterium]